jgi:two-component system, OmpR family, response regulator
MLVDAMNTTRSGRPALTRPDGTQLRVLVVDDDPDLAEVLTGALRYEGWEVRAAGDGASALAGSCCRTL